MLRIGVILMVGGVLGEAIGGEWFRKFLVWSYPDHASPFDDRWLKVKIGRGAIIGGAVLAAIGVVL